MANSLKNTKVNKPNDNKTVVNNKTRKNNLNSIYYAIYKNWFNPDLILLQKYKIFDKLCEITKKWEELGGGSWIDFGKGSENNTNNLAKKEKRLGGIYLYYINNIVIKNNLVEDKFNEHLQNHIHLIIKPDDTASIKLKYCLKICNSKNVIHENIPIKITIESNIGSIIDHLNKNILEKYKQMQNFDELYDYFIADKYSIKTNTGVKGNNSLFKKMKNKVSRYSFNNKSSIYTNGFTFEPENTSKTQLGPYVFSKKNNIFVKPKQYKPHCSSSSSSIKSSSTKLSSIKS